MADKAEKTEKGGASKGKPQSDDKAKKGKAEGGKSAAKKDLGELAVVPVGYVSRLYKKYRETVVPALRKKFEYKSAMQIPKVQKIVVNMGVGEATKNIKELDEAVEQLTLITGQKPRVNRAAVSVAQFKVRRGMPVGCSVTLRGSRMYDFLDRLISVALPRVRDFRGLATNAFDGRGNYNMGLKEQLIFTEIDYNKVTVTRGMNITVVTNAPTDAECKELLALLGMPFRKK